MNEKGFRVEVLVFSCNNGFVFVAVPLDHVAEVQRRLKGLGIGSSLHSIEEGEVMVLHPHTNLGPARIHALLAGQGWPSRRGGDLGRESHKGQA
jgi:hypothetical protein